MLKVKYSINKDTCFAYWVQTLLQWGWASSKADTEYYRSQGAPFSHEEEYALEQLKIVVEKKENSYLWLWERYAGYAIKNSDEKKIWYEVVSIFSPRFEELWKTEFPLLEAWRGELTSTNTEMMLEVFGATSKFLDVREMHGEIEVRLCTGHFPDAPEGHAKKEFPDFVIANISHTLHTHAPRVLGLIAHEILHKIEYQSPIFSDALKQAYENIIKPEGIYTDWKWKYLMTEAVIHSIASKRYNTYFGRMIMKDEKMIEGDVLLNLNMEKYGKSHGALIRVVAGRIESLTAHYLDEGKKIDQEYCDEVARTWVNLLTGK